MFCRYCGKKIDDNLQVCPFCGIPAYGPYIPQEPKDEPFGEFSPVNGDSTLSKEEQPKAERSADVAEQNGQQAFEQAEQKRTLVNNPALTGQSEQSAYSMPQPQPRPAKTVNGFAIAGFVIALAGILIDIVALACDSTTFGGMYVLSMIFSIIGTVKSKKLGSGKGFGIAGIVLSAIGLAFYAVVIFIAILVIIGISMR